MKNQDPPPPTSPVTALERRYRRLLRCYPPSHRAAHREEMLGVLLAAARPGQRRPGAGQTANLVACGLAIRVRRALTTGPWPDALAVLSLIAPAVMLVIAALNLAVTTREVAATGQGHPPAGAGGWPGLVPVLGGPAATLAGWLTAVLLSLAGRRRAATAVAFVPLACTLGNQLADVLHWTGAWTGGQPEILSAAALVGPVVLAGLAVCSLAFSVGPSRGLAIAGKRRACLMIAALSAGFGFPSVIYLISGWVLVDPAASMVSVLAIVVAVAVTRIRGAAGGWVAQSVAVALLVDLGPFADDLTANLLHLLDGLLAAAIVRLLALAWKRQVGQA